MEIDEPSFTFKPAQDGRRHMPEPPVVRVVAIEDVRLPALVGSERELESFYVGLLRFERVEGASGLVLKAENVQVHFHFVPAIEPREDFRPMVVELPHFSDLSRLLEEREIAFEWQRGLTPGTDVLLFRDPSGNFVAAMPRARVR